jgi:peptide/nickel transport system substrate-binding protein
MQKRRVGLRAIAVLTAIGLLAVAVIAASAWARSGRASATTLIDGTTDSITNIDPAGTYDFGTATLDQNVFEHLYEPRKNAQVRPSLATSCKPAGTVKTWRCTLRRGVKFHNGDAFTSADVKWSFDRTVNASIVKQAGANSPSSLLSNLKSVTTNGPNAVTFNLKSPQSTWPFILSTQGGVIVPKGEYPADKLLGNDQTQVGTGPFKLVRYTPGQQAVLERNDDYWGPKAKVDTLIIRYYKKSSTMKLAIQRGEIDMAFQTFTPTEIKSLETQSGVKVYKGNGAIIRYLVMNVKRAPTNNIAVRKAIAYMMPRQTIASRVYNGDVAPLYSMPPAGLAGHTDAFAALYGRSPNLAKARQVLQQAGLQTPVSLDIWWTPSHYGDASADEYAEIKRGLEQGGIFEVTLKSAEWAQYSKNLGTQYNLFQLGWFPDYADAENYVLSFYQTKNFTENGYSSPRMNRLLKQEQAAETPSERLAIIRQIQTLAAQDVPIVPYWQGKMIAVARNNVRGIPSTLDPAVWLRFWNLSKS